MALSNRFLVTANIEASDGGAEIARGNGKVVRARLSDALYFWKTDQGDLPDLDQLGVSAAKFGLDLKKPLDQRMARLDHLNVTFHAKLGTQGERVERIKRLAEELAALVHADPALVARAAVLVKADLQTEVVGEFPELQGTMGRKYALLQGEYASVAAAAEEHYKPQGPSDRVPTDPVSVAVALADKLDTLICFWAIDEKPTGSKDPYALRRAALGVIRILVENRIRFRLLTLPIYEVIEPNYRPQASVVDDLTSDDFYRVDFDNIIESIEDDRVGQIDRGLLEKAVRFARRQFDLDEFEGLKLEGDNSRYHIEVKGPVLDFANPHRDLLTFFHDRLKVYLREQGSRHDLIDAVITPQSDDLLQVVRRVQALGSFLDTEDGKNLLAGTKRAANILAAEEKKKTQVGETVEPALLRAEAEKKLFAAVNQAEKEAGQAIQNEDFSAAMLALSVLREPVDSFFEDVLVNDEDAAVRANRLALLARIRAATDQVADFSKIAG